MIVVLKTTVALPVDESSRKSDVVLSQFVSTIVLSILPAIFALVAGMWSALRASVSAESKNESRECLLKACFRLAT